MNFWVRLHVLRSFDCRTIRLLALVGLLSIFAGINVDELHAAQLLTEDVWADAQFVDLGVVPQLDA